ncbi:response regulator [Rhodothermus sp. AH-315-K08]|nr:response regulator [Rhodothermus sp. AH-315-K08]
MLCVDDEPEILNALKRQLRRDFVLVMESSPEDALDTLREQTFDAIVSDEIMPGLRGHEFLKQSREYAPDAVRILLTGYADNDALEAAVNESAIHRYIQKPWSGEDLASAINTAVSRLRDRAEERRQQTEALAESERLAVRSHELAVRAEGRTAPLELVQESSIAAAARILIAVLDWQGAELGKHSRRVGNLAMALGDRLGLSDQDLKVLHWGATLHDVGRARPTGADTPERGHVLSGAALVSEIPALAPTQDFIRHQDEHFGGGGFPAGISGADIPLGARVIAVANEFDRHQFPGEDSPAVPVQESLAHVEAQVPERFDPAVVEALAAHCSEDA